MLESAPTSLIVVFRSMDPVCSTLHQVAVLTSKFGRSASCVPQYPFSRSFREIFGVREDLIQRVRQSIHNPGVVRDRSQTKKTSIATAVGR